MRVPFVLFDDARLSGAAPARLYRAPQRILTATSPAEVPAVLAAARQAARDGAHLAGFMAYQGVAPARADAPLPFAWFGVFDRFATYAPDTVPDLLGDPAAGFVGTPQPQVTRADYQSAIERVLGYIRAGDIYQANLTFIAEVRVAGDAAAIYAGLRTRARAGYGALVWTGQDWLLSLSPELFFAMQGGQIHTRPMKGTATRLADPASDAAAARALAEDPKQRAENLMIVDLLRNDLSRVAATGSVAVPRLFHVESYPTLHQLTSSVTATAAPGVDAVGVLEALFPCGSITGAPKIRAMEVIREVEAAPRGIYTGAIGRIDAGGQDAAFNVAIRTLHLRDGEGSATLGLGSGVVADSQPEEEWRECLAKGRFAASTRRFDLIETMAFSPDDGVPLLDEHLQRMARSAAIFGFRFDRHAARNVLQAAGWSLREPSRLRLLLAPSGAIAVESAPAPPPASGPITVTIVPLPVDPRDFRLAHKTTDRAFYEDARRAAGTAEVLFVRDDGLLTEGSFTSLFVPGPDGLLRTPPATLGLLPGVLRASLLANGKAVEAPLTAEALSGPFFVGNALRGLLPARVASL